MFLNDITDVWSYSQREYPVLVISFGRRCLPDIYLSVSSNELPEARYATLAILQVTRSFLTEMSGPGLRYRLATVCTNYRFKKITRRFCNTNMYCMEVPW